MDTIFRLIPVKHVYYYARFRVKPHRHGRHHVGNDGAELGVLLELESAEHVSHGLLEPEQGRLLLLKHVILLLLLRGGVVVAVDVQQQQHVEGALRHLTQRGRGSGGDREGVGRGFNGQV
eukprot:1183122-Prorocentrum_minimum.AAC.1